MVLEFRGFWHIFLVFFAIYVVGAAGISGIRIPEAESVIHKHGRRKLDDITGAINIDCGISEDTLSADYKTGIQYNSDNSERTFIDTGVNRNISNDFISDELPISLRTLRSFPQGNRSCYTLKPPERKANIYLIRASFMYGNYDNLNKLPMFDLYVGVNLWDKVKFDHASHVVIKEIIHIPVTDSVYVCLLNTGSGTPFISVLELRHFHNSTYKSESGALVLHQRLDFGSTTNDIIRYRDDSYDRIWNPCNFRQSATLNNSFAVDSLRSTDFNLPSKVMQTAVHPVNVDETLSFEFEFVDQTLKFSVYMHFAELETPKSDQRRQFNIELNGKLLTTDVVLEYLQSKTITTKEPVRGAKLNFTLYKSVDSTLPPILNALEIYLVRDFWQQPTDQEEVNAIECIKAGYKVGKGWQGDPCVPFPSWDGLICKDGGYDPPRIISLNLSSRGLRGDISSSFSKFKSLQSLDLSKNSLTGPLPEFLSQLSDLRTLNVQGNKLSGSVPLSLMERSNNGSLSLRLDGNPNLCLLSGCKEEKKSIIIPIVATIIPLVLIFMALIILWRCKRKLGARISVKSHKEEGSSLKSDNRQFTYAEIVRITNNFSTVIGKGGFGTVYHGYLSDGAQVAVKMLSPTSAQASSQFQTEAHLLMRIHHRNLALFIGYCNEATNMGILYEYMACGNLEQYLSDKSMEALTWKERLQVAVDSAQGLEYLHHGCKPPIIHRDVKTANILLNDNLQAKIADFGFSKLILSESRSHLSTGVVGTVGYLDPEYYTSSRLTERSDVYSFGIVLLELITGQPAIIKTHDENIHIVTWVSSFIESGDIRKAVDPRLKGKIDTNSVWKFMEIAISCVPSISIQRPIMNHLVAELKECLDAEIDRERIEKESFRSSNSFEMVIVDLDAEKGPEAR